MDRAPLRIHRYCYGHVFERELVDRLHAEILEVEYLDLADVVLRQRTGVIDRRNCCFCHCDTPWFCGALPPRLNRGAVAPLFVVVTP